LRIGVGFGAAGASSPLAGVAPNALSGAETRLPLGLRGPNALSGAETCLRPACVAPAWPPVPTMPLQLSRC
jgi:hypothetical protein